MTLKFPTCCANCPRESQLLVNVAGDDRNAPLGIIVALNPTDESPEKPRGTTAQFSSTCAIPVLLKVTVETAGSRKI
jgi:hypothetical protein